MPDLTAIKIARDDGLAHHAAEAWKRLMPKSIQPAKIETLKRNKKSAIYRLQGAGPAGSDVIAKRCLTETAQTERTIYQEVLPCLPLPSLHCYGLVEDGSPEFRWLFLEDAGTELYAPALAEHRDAAARWLALMHACGSSVQAALRLPERGSGFYLARLRQARDNIVCGFANPALRAGERAVLEELRVRCDFLESRWEQLETLCQGVPPTLVHGDLKAKNFRVRHTRGGIALLAFDWEIAGWGVPAADLIRCPVPALYWSEARKHWPDLELSELRLVSEVGVIFRALIAIYWKSLALSYDYVEWPVEKLRLYLAKLAETTRSLGLE